MNSSEMSKRRLDSDVMKLVQSKHDVIFLNGLEEMVVKFYGPKDSSYEKGVWRVRVSISKDYPFNSPSISFMNKIFHPNVHEASGAICLDVINQAWSAIYDLCLIFECFLPQLLMYPNATDPLNQDAAMLLLHKPLEFKIKVAMYLEAYATEEKMRLFGPTQTANVADADNDDNSSTASSLSDLSHHAEDDDDENNNINSKDNKDNNDQSQL